MTLETKQSKVIESYQKRKTSKGIRNKSIVGYQNAECYQKKVKGIHKKVQKKNAHKECIQYCIKHGLCLRLRQCRGLKIMCHGLNFKNVQRS